MCEEVQHPATQVPKAMVATILINTIAGLIFLVPLCFVLPDIPMLTALLSGQPVPTIIKSAVGNSAGAFGLLIPLMVLAIICGIGCTTASSRCAWAFARDGAVPGAKIWMKVNHSLDVPLNAMMLCMVVEILLGLIYFGSSAAFNAFSGVGVISLTASYACPIAINLINGRKAVVGAKFSLGRFGYAANIIALCEWHARLSSVSCLADLCAQAGPPSRSRSSACRPLFLCRPRLSTMRPLSLSQLLRSRECGTGYGVTRTMPARLSRASDAAGWPGMTFDDKS